MKRNKFIYMLIFSLVFLGFTSGVKAKACLYYDNGTKWVDLEYNQGSNSNCYNQYNGQWTRDDAIANAFISGIQKVCAKKVNGAYDYRATIYSQETANACSDNGYSWQNVSDIVKDVYNLSQRTTNGSSGSNSTGNSGSTGSTQNVTSSVCVSENDISKDDCISHYGANSWKENERQCCYTTTTQAPTNLPSNYPTSNPDGNSAGDGSTTATSGTTGSDTMTVGFDCNDPSVAGIVSTIKTIYNLLKYATPVILIILGSVDFLKAVVAAKEDEIEKNKKRFINRLLLAVMIFLLLSVFQLITNILGSSGANESNSWLSCWNN